MDYSGVPGGALALKRLQEDHPDIRLSYDAALELHTLYGAYSKVQAALTQLFGQSGNQQPDTVQQATSGSLSERLSQKPSEDLSVKPNKQREQSRAVDTVRSPEHKPRAERETTPGAYGVDDTGQREGATPRLTWPLEEDSLLIVDADMFQYLQKYCKRDYEKILSLYGVEAVVVTNQGLTSLYLQPAAGGGVTHDLSLARHAMSQFFQDNETKICRSEFLKRSFSSGRDLQMAKDSLYLRHPKILLKEDEKNIYVIGNSRDVYEAKQFLLDRSLEPLLKTEENETKDEVARRCKLAPRFKESGVPSLGNRPTDFCLRGALTSQSRPKCSGPMLGFNVLSEPSQITERVPRASPQSTGEDILFKSPSSLPPALSIQSNDTFFNSDLIKNQPKMASLSTPLQDSTLVPLAVSGSTLKRANSFSGTPKCKALLTQQRSQDDTIKSTADARTQSSGLTDHLGKDRQVVYEEEIVAFHLMWKYIKEVHSVQVDDLTSDVLMKETMSGGSSAVTITLRGLCPSTLKSCRLGLQKLIDSVDSDFSVHKLALSDLGLTDPTHETLLACCNNARDSFRTVTIHINKKDVMLLGPKLLCSQVAASLLEVFSRDLSQMNKRLEFSIPSTPSSSKSNQATLIQTSEDQSAKLHSHSKNHVTTESRRGTTDGASIDQERRTNHSGFAEMKHVNGSAIQPRQYKDPVIKEKVKYIDTRDRNGQKTSVFGSKPGDNERENSLKSVTFPSEDASLSVKESLDSALKDSAHHKHKENQESRSSTEAELLPRGIRGQMSWSTLNINIQGYKNDLAIKVIYYIPDGIQEVRNLCRVLLVQSSRRFSHFWSLTYIKCKFLRLQILNVFSVFLPGRSSVPRKAISRRYV